MNQKQIEKEWQKMIKAETAYLNRSLKKEKGSWQDKIAKYVPDKFESALKEGFYKAFQVIFEKGTGVIEKTYNREKKEQNYKIQEFAAELKNSGKSVKAFRKSAVKSRAVNGVISAAEGAGMGVFGLGLPDIPLFLGLLLKSIYEIALSYGFSYDSEKEQIFILRLIETALLEKEELTEGNLKLNRIIDGKEKLPMDRESQMRRTANALANEVMYLKFVQGIPIVGILGGISDMVYHQKLSEYAELKYKRRFYGKMQKREGLSQ
ncbi:MAG: EcsC family protein [Roseburia sp.]|nr:EcsC family protein [Roseburia sp.]